MSLRALGLRLIKHAKLFTQPIFKKNNFGTIGEQINVRQPARTGAVRTSNVYNSTLRHVGAQLGVQARRILIDNVLNRVTNSLSADLRKKATRRLLYGDSGTFFAFVGVSLASGTGILTKEEELEGICWEMREAVSRIKWHYYNVDESLFEGEKITLKDLTLGKHIAKGTNGVVVEAKLKKSTELSTKTALKMMFNYDIQSNSMDILKAMYRETVPARIYDHINTVAPSGFEEAFSDRKRNLPPHPNIVKIYSVFTDYIQELEFCRELYPAALPQRIHPEGAGRNMSLFLLMQKYDTNLNDYLKTTSTTIRQSVLLFAQLLEAVAHLHAHEIAHRDLKADNLLLDTSEPDTPVLVISDFGCCLADKNHNLQIPFTSYEIDKGGNVALMAPEIVTQRPGTFSLLNYTRSDLWAAGTIGYEIFGATNPFYMDGKLKSGTYKENELPEMPNDTPDLIKLLIGNLLRRNPSKRLDPEVAANVCQLYLWAPTSWLNKLNFKQPSSSEILQWLLTLTTKILCEDRGGHFESSTIKGRRTLPEYLLISSFLCRAKLSNIKAALTWIRNVYSID